MQQYINQYEILLAKPGIEKLLGNIIHYHPVFRNKKKYYYNLTLFEEFAGVKHTKNFNYTLLRNKVEEKLEEVIQELYILEEKISNNYILHNAIEENIIVFQFIKNGLEFELLKSGARIAFNNIEYTNKLKLQEIYETKLYGGKILNKKEESILCFQEIVKSFQKNKKRLNTKEQNQYKSFIKIISHALKKQGYNLYAKKEVSHTYHAQSRIFFRRYGKLPIKRELYTQIFQDCLDILELSHIQIISTPVHGFSVGKNAFYIPEDTYFDEISLGKMFRLITHEILGHLLNWRNHQACFYDVRGKGSIMKEEGVAMLLENLMLGERFESLDLKPGTFCRILAGEILEGGDFRSFVRLRKKLVKGKVSTTTASFLRHKIGYPRYQVGVQHKDVTYVRGLMEVVKYIKKGGNPRALMSGKFGLEDISSGRCDFSEASEFQAPLPLVDIIIYSIMKGKDAPSDKKLKLGEDFRFFLVHKYGPCFSFFEDSGKLTEKQNNLLLDMIKIVKARKLFGKHKVSYQPIENIMIEHNREVRNIIK